MMEIPWEYGVAHSFVCFGAEINRVCYCISLECQPQWEALFINNALLSNMYGYLQIRVHKLEMQSNTTQVATFPLNNRMSPSPPKTIFGPNYESVDREDAIARFNVTGPQTPDHGS
jgi:hypothetical protein